MALLLCILVFTTVMQSGLVQSVPRDDNFPERPSTYVDMNRFRSELLYPHDREYLVDTINRAQAVRDTPLTFRLPFFGFDFRYVWIHRDGYLLFNKGLLEYTSPVKFPTPYIKDPTREEDPSLIAPWFSYQDIPYTVEGAGVYFQVVTLGSEKNESLSNRIKLDFKDAMIGSQDFVPTYALIVTWKNMTHADRMPRSKLRTNTYQAVIATDEKRTYAMFNYDAINWISDKDNYDGQKGIPPYIGFNAGNQTRAFEFEPYSQQPRVSRLPSLGYGNGLRGRFYFQINEEILPGCCIEKYQDINWSTRPKLTVFPRYGSMLGGTTVNVTGPCFENPDSIIRCKFGWFEVDGIYRSPNHVSCISPPVLYHGYVDLSISIDNGPFLFLGKYYMQTPDVIEADVNILDDSDKMEAPERFTIQWKHEKLTWDTRAPVTISLWGYRETNNTYPKLTYIDVLAEGSAMSGERQYSLDLEELQNRWNDGKLDIYFGFIAINLTYPDTDRSLPSPVLWSRPLPLAWYFRNQWKKSLGINWKGKICEEWYTREKYSDRFATTQCPCTSAQAKLDLGRFAPDPQCNVYFRKCENFYEAAHHCVRSGRPDVGGQLCCYDNSGELIQTGATMYEGRPIEFVNHLSKKEMLFSALSHWSRDVSPYFFCCKWADKGDNDETCDMYKNLRVSQDCSLYQPPSVASTSVASHILKYDGRNYTFNDGTHFLTYDGTNYTFNGKGEFVLTRDTVHKVDVQGRLEQPVYTTHWMPKINRTNLMAVAARDNLSSIVEFRVRPAAARWQYHMYVIVDDEYVYFWDENLRVQSFKGVTLYQPQHIYNMSHIVAMFDSGVGVEVMEENGRMTVHVYLPTAFRNKTRGLLGNWTGIKDDDFTGPDGYISAVPGVSSEAIHVDFGMKYRVTEATDERVGRSLFYHDSIPFTYYDDIDFKPEFDKTPPQIKR